MDELIAALTQIKLQADYEAAKARKGSQRYMLLTYLTDHLDVITRDFTERIKHAKEEASNRGINK